VLNIILVQIIGVYGVVLSSILAFIVSVPWANHTLFYYYFKESGLGNILRMLKDFAITIVVTAITYICCFAFPQGILWLMVRAAICAVVPNILLWLIYRSNESYNEIKLMVLAKAKKRR
jgi:hypothetical protein